MDQSDGSLTFLSSTQIWVWWTSRDPRLKQRILTWKKYRLYGWFLQTVAKFVFCASNLLFSQVSTDRHRETVGTLEIYNPGLNRRGATHFLPLRDSCLGRDPSFGNHWIRQWRWMIVVKQKEWTQLMFNASVKVFSFLNRTLHKSKKNSRSVAKQWEMEKCWITAESKIVVFIKNLFYVLAKTSVRFYYSITSFSETRNLQVMVKPTVTRDILCANPSLPEVRRLYVWDKQRKW